MLKWTKVELDAPRWRGGNCQAGVVGLVVAGLLGVVEAARQHVRQVSAAPVRLRR